MMHKATAPEGANSCPSALTAVVWATSLASGNRSSVASRVMPLIRYGGVPPLRGETAWPPNDVFHAARPPTTPYPD